MSDAEPPVVPSRVQRSRARAERAARRYAEFAPKHPVLGLPLVFALRYTARQGMLLASAAAFRLFLWLLPVALLIAGILAGLARDDQDSLQSAAKSAGITGAASQQAIAALREGHRSWWVAVLIGVVAFLWTTRTLMRNLAVVNAYAWQAPAPKMRQKDVLVTTLFFAGAWGLVFAVVALIGRIDDLLPGGFVTATVLQAAVVSGAWMLICLRLPDLRTSWVDLLPGCILFGSGFAVLDVVSRVYLPQKLERSERLYGSLGIAGAILAWLLIIGQLIVAAALINSVWAEYRVARASPRSSPGGPGRRAWW